MKIELFEKKENSRRHWKPLGARTTDIYYSISEDGMKDVCYAIREHNYLGDGKFRVVLWEGGKPTLPTIIPKKFKPNLTKKDYENCVRILKTWKEKNFFIPVVSDINFSELRIERDPAVYCTEELGLNRIYSVPIETYLEKYCDLDDNLSIVDFLDGESVTYDKLRRKVFVEVKEEVSEDEIRLVLFIDNWVNYQERKDSKAKLSSQIEDLKNRIKKSEDALGKFESVADMKLALSELEGKA
jgi:hypothetical protein